MSKPAPRKKGQILNIQQKRFVHLYLGAEGGVTFSNASLSYLWAYNYDRFPVKDKDGNYTKEYNTARVEGSRMIAKPHIIAYMESLLLEVGLDPNNIKMGIAKWSRQEKHPVVALSALEKLAKITGVMKDDTKVVDLPQLVALTATIQSILTPKK